MSWSLAFDILEIIVACCLMVTVLLQNRAAGAGGIFGQQTTVFRTRRGLERILYRATIGLAIVFVITSLASVRAHTVTAGTPPFDINSLPVQPPAVTPATPATPPADQATPAADQSSAPASPAASPEASPAAAPDAAPTQNP